MDGNSWDLMTCLLCHSNIVITQMWKSMTSISLLYSNTRNKSNKDLLGSVSSLGKVVIRCDNSAFLSHCVRSVWEFYFEIFSLQKFLVPFYLRVPAYAFKLVCNPQTYPFATQLVITNLCGKTTETSIYSFGYANVTTILVSFFRSDKV